MGIVQIVLSLLVGCVAALVAHALMPAGDLLHLLASVALGIVGALVGGFLGTLIRTPQPGARVHWASVSVSVIGAALLLLLWHYAPGPPVSVSPSAPKPIAPVVKRSSLLPAGEEPEAIVVLQKNAEGVMAPVLLGQLHTVPVEEEGQEVEKPDPLRPGNILIIRDMDEEVTKDLKITKGSAQPGGAYIAREHHELEYLGQVELVKGNKRLALEFGIKPPPATPTPTPAE